MGTIIWSGKEWATQYPWCVDPVHDEADKRCDCWYDESQISIDKNNQLSLNIGWNPRTFNIHGEDVLVNHGVGVIVSKDSYGYGYLKTEAQMPVGIGCWSAFWMFEENTCIPEIDIEMYSKDGTYHNSCLRPQDIESCIHCDPSANLPETKPKAPWFCIFNRNPSMSFNDYGIYWTENSLEFYINGKCWYQVRNQKIIEYLRGRRMTVILDIHIDCRYLEQFAINAPFIANYFTYFAR